MTETTTAPPVRIAAAIEWREITSIPERIQAATATDRIARRITHAHGTPVAVRCDVHEDGDAIGVDTHTTYEHAGSGVTEADAIRAAETIARLVSGRHWCGEGACEVHAQNWAAIERAAAEGVVAVA